MTAVLQSAHIVPLHLYNFSLCSVMFLWFSDYWFVLSFSEIFFSFSFREVGEKMRMMQMMEMMSP